MLRCAQIGECQRTPRVLRGKSFPHLAQCLAAQVIVDGSTAMFPRRVCSGCGMLHCIMLPSPGYALSGFIVGLLVGQTGVGGGALMTPLLVLLFGVHPATAVGTDLLYAAATKSVGTAVHGANHTVDWRVVGRLASGSVPATALTLLVLS